MIKLIPIYFFSALFITFLIMYLFTNQPQIIFKHPATSTTTYVDKNGLCYSYKKEEITCP